VCRQSCTLHYDVARDIPSTLAHFLKQNFSITLISHKQRHYKNLAGELFFNTKGCLCTLGIKPKPTARRIAFAIFRWFFGRRPVSLECFIRPISVMYSDIIVKFWPLVSYVLIHVVKLAFHLMHTSHIPELPRTLYSRTGLIPRISKASSCGLLRPCFHFFCSTPLKSCGAYTSPGCHCRYICRWYCARRSDSAYSLVEVAEGRSRPTSRIKRMVADSLLCWPAGEGARFEGCCVAVLLLRIERMSSAAVEVLIVLVRGRWALLELNAHLAFAALRKSNACMFCPWKARA